MLKFQGQLQKWYNQKVMKKFNLFLISIFALTAFLAGYLLISGDMGNNSRKITGTILDKFNSSQGSATEDPKLSDKKEEGLEPLSDRTVVSLTKSRGKEAVMYFDKNNGNTLEFNLTESKETIISGESMPNFISAIWSPTKEETVDLFYSQSDIIFKHHDLKNGKITVLDPAIKSLAFSLDGKSIVYYSNKIYEQALPGGPVIELGKITISEPSGNYPKKILDSRLENIKLSWPIKDKIVIKTQLPELFFLSEDGVLNKLSDDRSLFDENWSYSGNKLLFSITSQDGFEPMLFIKNINDRSDYPLNIEGTASKCTWSIDDVTIYCALAKSPSIDNIYKINTLDGSKKIVAEPGFTIKDISLSGLEDFITFTSASEEKLYGIKLP